MIRPSISLAFSIAILALMNGPARAEVILSPGGTAIAEGRRHVGNVEAGRRDLWPPGSTDIHRQYVAHGR